MGDDDSNDDMVFTVDTRRYLYEPEDIEERLQRETEQADRESGGKLL